MDGILNVYKEAGWTSNDVVQKLRGILKTKKVGHAGTLDPSVTGVLPVAVGKATRLLEYMDTAGKIYKGEVTLGFSTETEDAEGEVVERKELMAPYPTEEEVDLAIRSFVGKIQQTPPMYSAVKINGKKLYEYARAGQIVERPSREVEIKKFVRTSDIKFEAGLARFSFEVACSKGTYIRTLAVDLAAKLGYPGHMSFLQRTMANGLVIESAKTLSEIEEARDQGELEKLFQPLAFAVAGLPKIDLTESQFADVRVGKKIEFENIEEMGATLAVFYRDELVGTVLQRENQLKPKKILI